MEEIGNLKINGETFASYSLDKDTVFDYSNGDDRGEYFKQVKQQTGISPDEMWCLSQNFLQFIYPRLKRFRNKCCGYPGGMTKQQWKYKLNTMVWAIKHKILDDISYADKKRQHKLQVGLNMFSKYMYSFWD